VAGGGFSFWGNVNKENRDPNPLGSWLPIGQVGRPHGIRGEVHVRLYNPDSDALDVLERVRVVKGRETEVLTLEAASSRPKDYVVRFSGITSREAVQVWTGAEVSAERDRLPPLEPGEFYLADLVGCDVFVEAQLLGRVTRVRSDPSCDTAVIRKADDTVVELALLPDALQEVDVAARRVTLPNEEGLIEQ
jgi:16S rRNA processing protein RimM